MLSDHGLEYDRSDLMCLLDRKKKNVRGVRALVHTLHNDQLSPRKRQPGNEADNVFTHPAPLSPTPVVNRGAFVLGSPPPPPLNPLPFSFSSAEAAVSASPLRGSYRPYLRQPSQTADHKNHAPELGFLPPPTAYYLLPSGRRGSTQWLLSAGHTRC